MSDKSRNNKKRRSSSGSKSRRRWRNNRRKNRRCKRLLKESYKENRLRLRRPSWLKLRDNAKKIRKY